MLIAGTVGSARKTPNTIPSSRVAAFFSPHSAGKSTNLLVACLSFPLRRGCHSEISADGVEAAVWAAHCQGGDPSMGQKLAGNLKGGAFFFFLYSGLWAFSVKCWTFLSFSFFSSCRRALGWSEQMLPQRFSLSSTPTYHLLHQSPSTPISSASLTSDPRSSPSICCTELRQCGSWRNNSPRAYVINAALTIAKLYLFMYLHGRISPTVGVYKKATGNPQTAPTNRAPYFSNLLPRCRHGEVINK